MSDSIHRRYKPSGHALRQDIAQPAPSRCHSAHRHLGSREDAWRGEEFSAFNPRHATTIEIKTGVKKDGAITARRLGMDPVKLRLMNAVEEGYLGPGGDKYLGVNLKDALLRVSE